ncbi:MAG: hypothetical protein A2X52_06800 [Candidatus Rokubacteria bacterium GWC2_70_16]|nr:MAG: hypothetical protein A2X52_06800 [Candidatus Rokubacteria bacterium GWC2_70_16]
MVAIANSNRPDVRRTRKALGITFSLIPGPNRKVQEEYGVYDEEKRRLTPATMVVDKDSIIRFKYVGKDDEDRPGLSRILSVLRQLR